MDYQVQDFGQERQYEGVTSGMDEIYIPRELKEDRRPSLFGSGNGRIKEGTDNNKNSKEKNHKILFAQALRVFRDINTGTLYIEASALYALNKGGQYDDSYRYSLGLVPITREELAKLVRQYEEINQVHVEIIEIPIDMSNIYYYSNLDDFEKESKDIQTTNYDKQDDKLIDKEEDLLKMLNGEDGKKDYRNNKDRNKFNFK